MKKYIAPEYINEKVEVEDVITYSPIFNIGSAESEEAGGLPEGSGEVIVDLGALLGIK